MGFTMQRLDISLRRVPLSPSTIALPSHDSLWANPKAIEPKPHPMGVILLILKSCMTLVHHSTVIPKV